MSGSPVMSSRTMSWARSDLVLSWSSSVTARRLGCNSNVWQRPSKSQELIIDRLSRVHQGCLPLAEKCTNVNVLSRKCSTLPSCHPRDKSLRGIVATGTIGLSASSRLLFRRPRRVMNGSLGVVVLDAVAGMSVSAGKMMAGGIQGETQEEGFHRRHHRGTCTTRGAMLGGIVLCLVALGWPRERTV